MNQTEYLNKRDLQAVIDRAFALHDGLTIQIKNSSNHHCTNTMLFCRQCSENGMLCRFVENRGAEFLEKQRLIAIRDSLKEVAQSLMLLQRLESWQVMDRHETVRRLEESRTSLMDRVKQHRGRELDVLRELEECFDINTKSESNRTKPHFFLANGKQKTNKKRSKNGFLLCCATMLLRPKNWTKVVGVAAKVIVVTASISLVVNSGLIRSPKRADLSLVDSTTNTKHASINVLCGRG